MEREKIKRYRKKEKRKHPNEEQNKWVEREKKKERKKKIRKKVRKWWIKEIEIGKKENEMEKVTNGEMIVWDRCYVLQFSPREKQQKKRETKIRDGAKLSQLGIWNQIVDNSDSKPFEFGWQYNNDLDLNIKIIL